VRKCPFQSSRGRLLANDGVVVTDTAIMLSPLRETSSPPDRLHTGSVAPSFEI
jgi:hypothetical protein